MSYATGVSRISVSCKYAASPNGRSIAECWDRQDAREIFAHAAVVVRSELARHARVLAMHAREHDRTQIEALAVYIDGSKI